MRDVLRTPGVLRLFLASCVARLPMGALGLLLILHTHDVTGAYAAGGAVTAAYALGLGLSNPALARIADRRGQVRVLRIGAPVTAAAIVAQALLADGAPLGARVVLAAVAGAAQPPVGAFRRRLWNVLVEDDDLRHRAYATEGVLLEVVYLLGPVAIVGGIGSWSTTGALIFCATAGLGGGLAFSRHPAVRSLAGEPATGRDLVGALRAPGVVITLATFLTLGVTVGAVEVGVPAALEGMGDRSLTGIVLGLWGAGSMLGGLAIGRTAAPERPERRLAVLVAGWGRAARPARARDDPGRAGRRRRGRRSDDRPDLHGAQRPLGPHRRAGHADRGLHLDVDRHGRRDRGRRRAGRAAGRRGVAHGGARPGRHGAPGRVDRGRRPRPARADAGRGPQDLTAAAMSSAAGRGLVV